jgi:hypothetical protein
MEGRSKVLNRTGKKRSKDRIEAIFVFAVNRLGFFRVRSFVSNRNGPESGCERTSSDL